jgi:hypothetical protein
MKTSRTVIVVLSLLVLLLGYLQLSRTKTTATAPAKDLWHTNTVNLWHTNTVNLSRTNTVELWRTNTVVQNFTNEIVKEVPARLSPAAREAATVGYRYLNAPLVANASDALYKAAQIAVEVNTKACDKTQVAEDATTVKKSVEAALRAQGIAIGDNSPLRLNLTITPVLSTDVPRIAILAVRLDLKERTALQRQSDLIRVDSTLWSTAGSKLVRSASLEEDLRAGIQEQLEKFCKDYSKAKEKEKDLESRIPAMPNNFLPTP